MRRSRRGRNQVIRRGDTSTKGVKCKSQEERGNRALPIQVKCDVVYDGPCGYP